MISLFRSLFSPPRHLILMLIAIWLGLSLAEKRVERSGITKESLNNIVYYSILGYLLGGRLIFALANITAFVESPLSIFSPNIDLFDAWAGIVTAILVGFIYGKRKKLPPWPTLDALTPLFAILAIGLHLSHLAAGTAFGSPANVPWAIELWNAARHPTQIYELIASLLIFAFTWFRKPGSPAGSDFLLFSALTAGLRVFFEAFRGDSTLILGGIRAAQVFAWIVLSLVLLASEIRQPKEKTEE